MQIKNINYFSFSDSISIIDNPTNIIDFEFHNKTRYQYKSDDQDSVIHTNHYLTDELIKCVCEVEGSHKIGNYMPGTSIPIVSEKKLYKDKPEYAILLSWHISKELIKNLRKKGFRGKFIIPLPKPKVVGK